MNIITAAILFIGYFFAVARADATCGVGEWAGTSCVMLEQCPELLEPLQQLHKTDRIGHNAFLTNRVRPATCGVYRQLPMVCCPNKRTQRETTKAPVKPIDCGNVTWNKSLNPDGMPVNLDEFPWLALLEYDTGCGKKFGCGGVLISDRHVLTSAQCLDPYTDNKLVSVRLGEHDLRTARDCLDNPDSGYCSAQPIDVGIEKQMVHESYSFFRGPSDLEDEGYDIAVLKLNRSVITNVIQPICLPDPKEIANSVTAGKLLSAGWGFAGNTNYPQSLVKLMSRLKPVDITECYRSYRFGMKEDMTCGRSMLHKNDCIADWGGPLMGFNNARKMTVMGISSSVNNRFCQQKDMPTAYVDVKKYVDWIREKMQN